MYDTFISILLRVEYKSGGSSAGACERRVQPSRTGADDEDVEDLRTRSMGHVVARSRSRICCSVVVSNQVCESQYRNEEEHC